MDDAVNRVLGPPVEPPEDVWAVALSGALEDERPPAELAALLPGPAAPPGGAEADPDPDEGDPGPDPADSDALPDDPDPDDADPDDASWPAWEGAFQAERSPVDLFEVGPLPDDPLPVDPPGADDLGPAW